MRLHSALMALGAALWWGMSEAKESVLGLDQVSLLKRHGYHTHEHFVVTQDDYVLSLFNVQRAESTRNTAYKSKPVLLQAGLMDSSKSLVNLEKDSLALQLVERGYDVWLANNRGNAWSKRHVDKDYKEAEFWEFSWDHMASYDLISETEYVLNYTGHSSLAYVGHSQGTMQAFAALSEPQGVALAKKIDVFIALAPVAFLGHLSSPLLQFMGRSPLPKLIELLGVHDFAETPEELRDLFPDVCNLIPEGCNDLLALGFGKSTHIEKKDYEVFVTDWPSGTSTRNMLHFIQMMKHGKFQKYDLGRKGNLAAYGVEHAPEYNLTHFVANKVPTLLVSGTNDMLANPTDVAALEEIIKETVINHIQIKGYNHMDPLWARDATKLVYPHVIQALDKYTAGKQREELKDLSALQ